jgi:N-acetylmuramoyl-L-alanine amidase
VLDLEDVEFNAMLEQLPGKISPADPYVSGVRIGRFKPGVVRLVLDLKTQVKPQVFTLRPVGEYGDRLVLDVYPLVEADRSWHCSTRKLFRREPLPRRKML